MIGLARSSLQYQAAQRDRDDDALRLALIRLAKQYGRYGYRKIAELLRIEGWKVNHKKVERIWREEGLQLPQRHKKRRRLYHKDASIIRLRPTHPNHVWSIDFVHDKLCNGRSYKMLTVLDEYTRQALAVAVRTRMGAEDVLEALYPLLLRYGTPKYIRSDTPLKVVCKGGLPSGPTIPLLRNLACAWPPTAIFHEELISIAASLGSDLLCPPALSGDARRDRPSDRPACCP